MGKREGNDQITNFLLCQERRTRTHPACFEPRKKDAFEDHRSHVERLCSSPPSLRSWPQYRTNQTRWGFELRTVWACMLARSPQRDSNALTTRERIKKKTRTRMADLNDNADGYWNLKVGIEMKRQCCTTSTEIIFISTCYRAPPPFRYFFPFTAGKIFAMGKEVRFGFPYSYFMFETPAPAGNARYYIALYWFLLCVRRWLQ